MAVLIGIFACERAVVPGLLDELFHLVDTAELNADIRVLACLVDAFVEHFADMLGLDIHLQHVLVLVDRYLVCVAFVDKGLEVTVVCLCPYLGHTVLATGQVEGCQCHDGQHVNPVHVELWHVHLRSVRVAPNIILLFLFHSFSILDS